MYPAQYNSWFPSDDNDDTAYIPDFKNRTMRFGSINQSLHHSDIISTSSGHSQTPCIDFQVPVHSDSLSLSYSHSVLSFSSLNSPSVTDSQTSNSSSSSVPPIIGIEALFKLNTPSPFTNCSPPIRFQSRIDSEIGGDYSAQSVKAGVKPVCILTSLCVLQVNSSPSFTTFQFLW